jgi:hypothetical protein
MPPSLRIHCRCNLTRRQAALRTKGGRPARRRAPEPFPAPRSRPSAPGGPRRVVCLSTGASAGSHLPCNPSSSLQPQPLGGGGSATGVAAGAAGASSGLLRATQQTSEAAERRRHRSVPRRGFVPLPSRYPSSCERVYCPSSISTSTTLLERRSYRQLTATCAIAPKPF